MNLLEELRSNNETWNGTMDRLSKALPDEEGILVNALDVLNGRRNWIIKELGRKEHGFERD